MVVRELITLLGFQVDTAKLKQYDQGMAKVINTVKQTDHAVTMLGTHAAGRLKEIPTTFNFLWDDTKIKQYAQSIGKVVRVASWAGLAVSALGGVFVNAAGKMEQTQTSFEVMLGSAEKAKRLVADLYEMGAKTPYESKDLLENVKLLLLYGGTAESAKKDIYMLGDVASGNAEKLGLLSYAFAQVQGNGRLMGQDLLQMINAGFNPLQIISEKTGKSLMQLRKEMEQGGISSDMVREAFVIATSEGGRFYKSMEKQSKTLFGRLSTFMDNISMMFTRVGNGILPMVGDLLDEFSKFMDQNGEIIVSGLIEFFKGLLYGIGYVVVITEELINKAGGLDKILKTVGGTVKFVFGVIAWFAKTAWNLRMILIPLIATLLLYNVVMKAITLGAAIAEYVRYLLWFTKGARGAAVAQTLFNTSMLANPVFWVIAGIVALIAVGYLLIKNWDKVVKFFKWAWGGITWAFQTAWNFIWGLLDNKWIQGFLAYFAPFIGLPVLIIKNWDTIIGFFQNLWKILSVGFNNIWNGILDKIKGIWAWVVNIIEKAQKFLGIKPQPKDEPKPGNPKPWSDGPPPPGWPVPKYKQGTPFVPEDQFAYLHKGEGIIPAGMRFRGGNQVNTTNINVESSVAVTVPPGTTKNQAEFLKNEVRSIIRDEWQNVLSRTKAAHPLTQEMS